ncbi:hypothetical protein ACS0TY_025464 [Phlomoides rotata]
MCFEAQCSSCGKKTWQGCGRHVPAVYNRIPNGQHCHCKAWPGVNPGGAAVDSKESSSCSIL